MCGSVKAELALKGAPRGGGVSMNKQRQHFLSLFRPNQLLGAKIHYPVNATDDLKMGNCFSLPYISDSNLPIALIKKKQD
jgi:hypothetical protein